MRRCGAASFGVISSTAGKLPRRPRGWYSNTTFYWYNITVSICFHFMAKFVFERFTYLRKLMPKNTTAEFKCALTFLILSTFLKLRIQYSKVLLDSPNMSKIRYFWYKKAHFIICGLVRKIPKSKLRVQIFFRADKDRQREIIWEGTKIYRNRSFHQRTFLEVVKIL